ncbi:MAG: DUF6429 family protein [Planctomycetota bacterium]|jgi:hypothetical protein
MEFDKDKVDEVTLALFHFVMWQDHGCVRAWKGFDWDTLGRLYEKGLIENPRGKAKSVIVTEEGVKKAEEFFLKHFAAK